MKTIEKYVFTSFLTSFLLAFLVLTFVLTIGLMFQIVGYILDGLAPALIGEFVLVSFPETLQWTVPLAILVASVLVFSRMSADSEVAAMRACGINLYSIMKWPVVFGLACSLLGAWVNNEVVPRGHEVRRNLKAKVSVGNGIDILKPGLWITDFPKVKIYFTGKEGRWIRNLTVIDETSKVPRTIRAAQALVTEEGRDVYFDLRDMTMSPIDEDHPGMMRMARYQHVMKDALKESNYKKKLSDLRFFELLTDIEARIGTLAFRRDQAEARTDKGRAQLHEMRRNLSKAKVELSSRFVLAAASLCFVLVGIPLGIRAQRRESSIGMAISLAISLGYYLCVMLMQSLQKSYAIHPEFLIGLPVVASLGLAVWFTRKNL